MSQVQAKPPIKIFLASSFELKAERDAFEIAIRRKNNLWQAENKPYLDLWIWETASEAMSPTRSQDEYNKIIKTVDIFVLLLWKVAGKYTQEEFRVVDKLFKQTRKPLIIVCQKESPEITADLESFLNNFKTVGKEYFYSQFQDQSTLIFCFNNELDLYYNRLYPSQLSEVQKLRQEMLNGLHRRYEGRYRKKMDIELSFKLDLSLTYTTTGINKRYVEDYFVDGLYNKDISNFNSLFEEFETKVKRLLILGEPGSGKTVFLLELGMYLIKKALEDPGYPIPVLLNLATWRDNEQSFETWLESNLVFAGGEAGISKQYASELVSGNNLLLLLDGLDEVSVPNRMACIERLSNYQFRTENSKETSSYPQLIISSRKKEYLSSSLEVPVRASIEIMPLTPKGIIQTLEERKENSSVNLFLKYIDKDPDIAISLRTAFEVHMSLHLVHTYNFKNLDTGELLKTYVKLETDRLKQIGPKYHIYLSFLALKVSQTSRVNSIEMADIRPDFLKYRFLYHFIAGFFQGFIMFLIISWLVGGFKVMDNYTNALIIGSITGLLLVILNRISTGIKKFIENPVKKNIWKHFVRGGIVGLAITLYTITVMRNGFELELRTSRDYFSYLLEVCFMGLLFEFSIRFFRFLMSGISNLINDRIETQEIQEFNIDRWQKKKFGKGIKEGFLIGFITSFVVMIFGITFGAFNEYSSARFTNVYHEHPRNVILDSSFLLTLPVALFLLSFSGLFIAVIRGLYKGFFTVKNVPKINGAYFRLYAQIKYDFFHWYLIVASYMLIGHMFGQVNILMALIIAACIALPIAFLTSPLYKHLIVRILLFFAGKMPAKLSKFLDDVAKTGLMEKDGGQWRFRHQLIQESLSKDAD